MYPALPKSYKGVYPFKLGATSFTYPDHIIPNIKMLGPYLDEIELLLFESAPSSLPSRADINEIRRLAAAFDLTYNIHLPLDISLGAPDPSRRQADLETIKHIIDLTASLSPSTRTLHLPYDETDAEPERIQRWRERLCQSIKQLLAAGIDSESISIENLDYPFEWVEAILNDFNLSVCIDIGHLMVNQYDVEAAFDKYHAKTTIIHLHGVENNQDHLSLDRMSPEKTEIIIKKLQRFGQVVSLEVFSYEKLVGSLDFLDKCWR
ncbi:MAG: cobamide remodeling phosphodiesterase CbiR [Pseudomonadota bacterium]|uniref:Sugar phosphate isomerase/epimerase n=1 Tax=Candidatus Desulfatibia profunda TaxID=2841695 RepID=A0A8J6TMP7_9BACT|nr:sugar phosphate isomerase/epimerase [Candidatus Desulfatibia profunda]MBL7179971.1 sugar phosphate isomerase/epimerase [Desulfobacterales bacterium]MBU0698609.1 sugar phosphate isomerase/epimerase [Pseudomonadota bacterium]